MPLYHIQLKVFVKQDNSTPQVWQYCMCLSRLDTGQHTITLLQTCDRSIVKIHCTDHPKVIASSFIPPLESPQKIYLKKKKIINNQLQIILSENIYYLI